MCFWIVNVNGGLHFASFSLPVHCSAFCIFKLLNFTVYIKIFCGVWHIRLCTGTCYAGILYIRLVHKACGAESTTSFCLPLLSTLFFRSLALCHSFLYAFIINIQYCIGRCNIYKIFYKYFESFCFYINNIVDLSMSYFAFYLFSLCERKEKTTNDVKWFVWCNTFTIVELKGEWSFTYHIPAYDTCIGHRLYSAVTSVIAFFMDVNQLRCEKKPRLLEFT